MQFMLVNALALSVDTQCDIIRSTIPGATYCMYSRSIGSLQTAIGFTHNCADKPEEVIS